MWRCLTKSLVSWLASTRLKGKNNFQLVVCWTRDVSESHTFRIKQTTFISELVGFSFYISSHTLNRWEIMSFREIDRNYQLLCDCRDKKNVKKTTSFKYPKFPFSSSKSIIIFLLLWRVCLSKNCWKRKYVSIINSIDL